MIALLFLLGIGMWLAMAVMLSKKIPRWLGFTKHKTILSVLLFPAVLAAPIADDLIGRRQFQSLCEQEAVVTLSTDWASVNRAKSLYLTRIELDGSAIPIYSYNVQYVDVDKNKVFLSTKTLTTYGGFLHRHLYGLGSASECRPKNVEQTFKQINIDNLIEKGKSK